MISRALVCLLLPVLMVATSPASRAAEPVRLITPEEAGLPMPDATGGTTRNVTRGPGIDPVAPAAAGVGRDPFRLALRFKPRNGVAIDPASVRVLYRRQPAVDITARLKPFVTADGIDAPAVLVPPGRHVLDVEVTDKQGRVGQGRVGQGRITLTVEPSP